MPVPINIGRLVYFLSGELALAHHKQAAGSVVIGFSVLLLKLPCFSLRELSVSFRDIALFEDPSQEPQPLSEL